MNKGFLFIIISVYLLPSVNLYAQQKIKFCNGSKVVVSYTKIEDYQLICDAVKSVIKIAKKIGLGEEMNVSISLEDRLIINSTGKSLAFFNPNSMEIQVLSLDACKKAFTEEGILGQPIDKELHRSIIIHELAHALFWKNIGNNDIAREIHEYFAYTIQLALLDKFHRDQVILSGNVPAFSTMSEISQEYYLLNPTRFAVKSYLHFISTKEDWPYLANLLHLN